MTQRRTSLLDTNDCGFSIDTDGIAILSLFHMAVTVTVTVMLTVIGMVINEQPD